MERSYERKTGAHIEHQPKKQTDRAAGSKLAGKSALKLASVKNPKVLRTQQSMGRTALKNTSPRRAR
jgi:hypothetical protein